jgi:hypothetical protein
VYEAAALASADECDGVMKARFGAKSLEFGEVSHGLSFQNQDVKLA